MILSSRKFVVFLRRVLKILIILGAVDLVSLSFAASDITYQLVQPPNVVQDPVSNETEGDLKPKESSSKNFEIRNSEKTVADYSHSSYHQSEYFFSVSEVKRLAKIEQELIPCLYKIWKRLNGLKASSNRNKRFQLSRYLNDYQRSVFPSKLADQQDMVAYSPPKIFATDRGLGKATKAVSNHPLKVFRLLRRLCYDFPKILSNLKERNELVEISKKIVPPIPLEDLDGAADGIMRIQETYNISTVDLSNGKLMDLETHSGLSALDVHYIGKRGLSTKRFTQGILWLHQAYRMTTTGQDKTVKAGVVKADLIMGIVLHNSYMNFSHHNEYTFPNRVSADVDRLDTPEHLQTSLGFGTFKTVDKNQFDTTTFHSLCRGKNLRGPQFTKTLTCWYKRDNPWLLIKPLKVEMHNEVAGLVQFYDILPNEVIRQLRDQAGTKLKRAGVVGLTKEKKALLSYGRISNSAWINDSMNSVLFKIPKLIKEATGLDAKTGMAAEESQVSCYGPVGGFYDTHFDSFYEKTRFLRNLTAQEILRGDRMATIMFYLNTLNAGGGGGTGFPRLGVLTQPIKGSALFWFNLHKNGDQNGLLLHGGCPVLHGEKWVVNKWIRASSQMFIEKCSKNRYD